MVRFTGTFLKTVRYAAGDGDRLAPLIVGDRPPEPQPAGGVHGEPVEPSTSAGEVLRAIGGVEREGRPGTARPAWAAGDWFLGLGLAAMAALVIAGQHLRGARLRHRAARRPRLADGDRPDPPLHFVEPAPGCLRCLGDSRPRPGSTGRPVIFRENLRKFFAAVLRDGLAATNRPTDRPIRIGF